MKNSASLRRQDRIMKLLATERRMRVRELADALNVSGWTVRRDLAQLEERHLVVRSYGMVELGAHEALRHYAQSMQRHEDQSLMAAKTRIGRCAARLLHDNMRVAMGAGTTTLACARALRQRAIDLVVMTNGLNIAIELTGLPHIELICTGGTAHEDFFTLTGLVARRAIKTHSFDAAIIGVSGISCESGFTVDSHLNAEILEAMIRNAHYVIVLADHRKFGHTRFAKLADLGDADVIVTDSAPDERLADSLVAAGIQVIVAGDAGGDVDCAAPHP